MRVKGPNALLVEGMGINHLLVQLSPETIIQILMAARMDPPMSIKSTLTILMTGLLNPYISWARRCWPLLTLDVIYTCAVIRF